MQERLIFLIGSPRSGTTLFQRMIGSHSAISAPPEPHLVTPLAHLGLYHNVEKAPYDHLNSATSQKEYVAGLPGGEQDYLDACAAYLDVLYGARLRRDGKERLLDKTPAYALVTDFLVKVYPRAKYLVLTRNPLAIWDSFAASFFDGDYEAAHRHNRLLERYVPAIAHLLRTRPVPLYPVRYEALVKEPERLLREMCDYLGLAYESGMVEYGSHEHDTQGRGDPVGVARHSRPVTGSVKKWAAAMAADPAKRAFAEALVDRLDEDDLRVWGYPKEKLLAPLREAAAQGAAAPPLPPLDRHRLERMVVKTVRTGLRRHPELRRLTEKLRFYADVFLRE